MNVGQLVKLGTNELFPLGFEPVTMGRHADNKIILADKQVSRFHAEVVMQGGRWVVRDLGSANGTYVNGQRIGRPCVLTSGDTIRLGQTSFRVDLPEGVAEQDTLVSVRVPPPSPATQARSVVPWLAILFGLGAVLLVIILLAFVLWPQLRGDGTIAQITPTRVQATPVSVSATPVEVTVTAVDSTASATETAPPPRPTETTIPTLPPPSPEPSFTPTDLPPTPTGTPIPVPVIGYFRADRTTVERGQCARLEWGRIEHASSVFITGVGQVNDSGKLDVCPDSTRAYTLQVTGPGGSAQQSIQIAVQPPVGPIIEYFRVVPSIIAPGDCAQLEWGKVENADSAEIEPGIGGVGTPGSQEICPTSTTTFVLTAQSAAGMSTAEATLLILTGSDLQPVISFFTASPSSILAGECTTLSWGKVDYATSVEINNNIGGVATPDSKEICPGATTTFIMTAVGPGGTTENRVTVSVSPGRLANLPDLVVESILFEPNPCYQAQNCAVRVKIRNDGTMDAGNFVLRWAPEGQDAVPVEWDLDRLDAGKDKTLNYNWIPELAIENWRTVATVDAYNEVSEIEEGTANSLEQFITVLEP